MRISESLLFNIHTLTGALLHLLDNGAAAENIEIAERDLIEYLKAALYAGNNAAGGIDNSGLKALAEFENV